MKKIILLFAAAAIVFAGCTEKEETTASSIELSVESIPAGPEGGTFEIQITSSEDWRISGKTVDWMSLSADGGKSGESLSVIVSPNSTMESKSAEFKIFAGSVAKTVTVTSSPLYVIELLDDAEVDVVSGGGSVNYSITTNVPVIEVGFSGDGASWITYEKRSDAFGKTVLSFTVAESEIYKSRSSEVTLTGAGVSATFTLIQAQVDAIISELEGNRLETDLDEQDVKFSVRHNVELDDLVLPEWIELKGTDTQPTAEDGLQTSELTFHLDEAPATRVGTLSFTYNGSAFIGLNSTPMLCNNEAAKAAAEEQLAWFGKMLKRYRKCNHIFVFSHHPLALREKSAVEHKSAYDEPFRTEYAELMKKYGVTAIFAGHTHITEPTEVEGMPMITVGASSYPLYGGETGINVVEVTPEDFHSEFVVNGSDKRVRLH